ncbi:MAG: permease [Candidatus Hodarchaeales archaeon]
MNLIEILQGALESAALTLLDYLSLHVLLCLIPAFFIAGAMAYFIPKDTIIRYMGKDTDPKIAYPVATASGFLLAVCSCTVLPLFVGIWKRGAGLGPAITFLFVAPAVNILALTYTGTLIGLDIAIARGLLAIIFAIFIGLIMAKTFGNETDQTESSKNIKNHVNLHQSDQNYRETLMNKLSIILIILLGICSISLAVLDTSIIDVLEESLFSGIPIIDKLFQNPYALQTSIFLFGLCILVIITFKINSDELILFLWLVYILMTGTSQIQYFFGDIEIYGILINPSIMNMSAKIVLTSIVTIGLIIFVFKRINSDDINNWLTETWFFVKSIFPLIIIGVTVAGFIRFFIPHDLVATLVGQNTVLANLIAVLFGVFMYFPTLMEVPIAKIFLDFGMARGPLLAYLLADPELSIQSILVTQKFLGNKMNTVFVGLVTIFSVCSGLIFGLFIGDAMSLW